MDYHFANEEIFLISRNFATYAKYLYQLNEWIDQKSTFRIHPDDPLNYSDKEIEICTEVGLNDCYPLRKDETTILNEFFYQKNTDSS